MQAHEYALQARLEEKVISFIDDGHGVTETAKTFGISRATIYRWQKRPELAATAVKTRKRKIDIAALIEDVERDATTPLQERAKRFGVTPSALCYQFKKRKITRKKQQLRYQERDHEARIAYCQRLREQIKQYGIKSLVFIDETGFDKMPYPVHGWSERGKKIYGERQGKRCKRENLVAGRRKHQKDLIAPMLFEGSLNAEAFEQWLAKALLPSLEITSVLIMDNAPIHRKNRIKEIVDRAGHKVLFLLTYSPDLNDIEHDSSALKRLRMYAPAGTSIDEIIKLYCAG